jgi:Lactoylglutathione lyase and related lyases
MAPKTPYPVRFDHCVVHVSDWERSNHFYSEVLGAELISVNGRSAYRFGRVQLNLHGPGVSAGPLAKLPVQPGNSDLCFVWEGPIATAVEHLRSKGVAVELGPVSRAGAQGAGRSVYFRDPDGSLLEFISYSDIAAKEG